MPNKPNNPKRKESVHFLYSQSEKSASSLQASDDDLSTSRKKMIRFALDYPIRDIRTYSGYKGDLLIEITTHEEVILPKLQEYAESLEMSTVIKKLYEMRIFKIYCIEPDESIYQIKEPE